MGMRWLLDRVAEIRTGRSAVKHHFGRQRRVGRMIAEAMQKGQQQKASSQWEEANAETELGKSA